jgi:hypothetical protein
MRQWVNPVLNFDHIGNSMLSLFVVTTMDKWFEIAHRGMDVTEVDHQPVTDASSINVLFFIAFVLLSSLFWVYLLVGALIDTYRRIAAATGEMVFTTPGQQNWAEALKMKQKQNALLHGEITASRCFSSESGFSGWCSGSGSRCSSWVASVSTCS